MDISVKLCGFTNKQTIDIAINSGANLIGFVFHSPSPRNIEPIEAGKLTDNLPNNIKKVAVICDADNQKITEIIFHLKPDFLQLHGKETLTRIREIKNLFNLPIIKAIGIASKSDLEEIKLYEDVADILLFDTKIKDDLGGSGKTFDWKILQNLQTKKECFLSGGLNINNIEEALKITNAKMIDLSSGIEEIRGIKSAKLITEFMNKIGELKKKR